MSGGWGTARVHMNPLLIKEEKNIKLIKCLPPGMSSYDKTLHSSKRKTPDFPTASIYLPDNAFECVQHPQFHQFHLFDTNPEHIPTCLDSP